MATRKRGVKAQGSGTMGPRSTLSRELAMRAKAKRDRLVEKCKKDVVAFAEFVFDKPDGTPVRCGRMHREWHELADEHERLLIVAPRGHYKCLLPLDFLTLADGTRVRVKDLPGRFEVVTWTENRGWHVAAAESRENCVQPIVRIRTRTGREQDVSSEHPFWTPRGWVEARDLRPGDRVALGSGCGGAMRLQGYDEELAWLAGILIGDGSMNGGSVVFTKADRRFVTQAARIASAHGWSVTNHGDPGNHGICGALSWARGLGMMGHLSKHKRVPDAAWTWDRAAAGAFIAGYFDSDGSVIDAKAGRLVWFSSASKGLLQDVQALLNRFGVFSMLGEANSSYEGKPYLSWYLRVSGSSMAVLYDLLPTWLDSTKKDRLRAAIDRLDGRAPNDNADVIPDEIVDRLSGRFKRITPRLDNRRPHGHQRWKVLARADGEGNLAVRRNADLAWDYVEAVEDRPADMTYAITVPGSHTHMAGDFITHNTGMMVIARTLWELGNNPNHLIKIICQSDAKAVKRLSEIREHLRGNKRLHMVFPHLRPQRHLDLEWNKHMVTVERTLRSPDPSIEALGITSSASGDRATRIIADDVVDRRNAITLPRVRASIKEAWDDWVNLLLPGGRIIYVATLWHQSDLTHQLIASDSWATAWYEITPEMGSYCRLPDGTERRSDEPLWGVDDRCPIHGGRHISDGIAERRGGSDGRAHGAAVCRCGPWSGVALRRRRKELGPRKFARGFSNRPLGDDEARINPLWIQYYEDVPSSDLVRIASFDLATAKGVRNDWTARVVLAIDLERGKIYVEDARHYKHTFPEKARLLKETHASFHPEFMVVELASGGRELMEFMHENSVLPIRGIRPRGSKGDRLDRISPYIESGIVRFNPKLDPHAGVVSPDYGDLVGELCSFPVGEHDDLMDALVHGLRFATVVYPQLIEASAPAEAEAQRPSSRVLVF